MTTTTKIQSETVWEDCCTELEKTLSAIELKTWIKPLHVHIDANQVVLYAPNQFVKEWISEKYLARITEILTSLRDTETLVSVQVGEYRVATSEKANAVTETKKASKESPPPALSIGQNTTGKPSHTRPKRLQHASNINTSFTFDSFVEGKSNQLARAAASQVAENPGTVYNPLFVYGGVGLGKTHLIHAIGNRIMLNPGAKVVYLHSERFVADMVKALQTNRMEDFKRFYRSVDALLIDDIQFFAGKDRSQEEFFHTFNALFEKQQQIILTSDCYPKEIAGVEERLRSRFGWGLTVCVEPPELETRVAILISKAEQSNIQLPHEVAFFIAKRISSNVRELEGALKRVIANAHFTGKPITLDLVKEALKDLLALQEKLVTIENIQKTVAEYYRVRVADLLSKRRTRVIARPRQMAMALAKHLTTHSLPEIGEAFGGRDHTTVIHACRTIADLVEKERDIAQDHSNLLRTLTN